MSLIENSKRWLAVGAITLAMCTVSVAQAQKDHTHKAEPGCGGWDADWDHCRPANYRQVPDGGSGAGYLLTAGVVCLGALFVHSRRLTA